MNDSDFAYLITTILCLGMACFAAFPLSHGKGLINSIAYTFCLVVLVACVVFLGYQVIMIAEGLVPKEETIRLVPTDQLAACDEAREGQLVFDTTREQLVRCTREEGR